MFGRVLNMPLDYLSCFTMVLREIHEKVDICQTDYSIYSKLRIFLYSEVIHGSITFRLNQRLTKVKITIKCQLLNLMFLFLFFTCIKPVAYFLGMCSCDRTYHYIPLHKIFFTIFTVGLKQKVKI